MLSEQRIREEIEKFTKNFKHVLDCGLATADINAGRALMQLAATTALDAFYFVLEEKRPKFKCDDVTKMNTGL